MAKAKISEKKITTTKLSIEGTLNLDGDNLIIEVEDEGEVSIKEKLEKYNGSYGSLVWTEKVEEEIIE